MRRYRYSSWDGTQDPFAVDADDLMDAMGDDLASHGDLSQALRNLMRRGMQGQMGSGFEGLREMLERLKQQSRERLERYNLASMIDELKQRMDEILQMERSDLDGQAQPGQQRPADPQGTQDNQGSQSTTESGSAADQPPNRSPQQDPDGQPGRHGQPGSQTPLENTERQQRLQFLNQLPSDFAGRTRELNNYEFFNPEAQQAFDELMDMLKQQAMGNMFREMAQRLANMTQEELQRLKDMLADLNQMMDQQIWGEEPDFEEFMQKYGDMFGPNPPQNLEELGQQLASQIAQIQSLFNSLPFSNAYSF